MPGAHHRPPLPRQRSRREQADVRECFLVAAGYGDLSSERAYLRTESLFPVIEVDAGRGVEFVLNRGTALRLRGSGAEAAPRRP